MIRKIDQSAFRLLVHYRPVLQFAILLLLCSPALVSAFGASTNMQDSWQVDQDEPVLANTLWEIAQPGQVKEGENGSDRDEPPTPHGNASPTKTAERSRSAVILSDRRERLPDPPDFLHALLRGPPFP